jgi:hypothetical protein
MLRSDVFFALIGLGGRDDTAKSAAATAHQLLEQFPSLPACRSELFDRQESFRQIVGERGELRSAGRGGFEPLFFPDEVIVAVESDSRAEVSVDEVRGLGENFESVWDDLGKKRGAVPSSNANVIWVDGESDQFEVSRENALKECGLLGS